MIISIVFFQFGPSPIDIHFHDFFGGKEFIFLREKIIIAISSMHIQ